MHVGQAHNSKRHIHISECGEKFYHSKSRCELDGKDIWQIERVKVNRTIIPVSQSSQDDSDEEDNNEAAKDEEDPIGGNGDVTNIRTEMIKFKF